jgi:DNA-binding XRE family transcriptional regulator|tara:strand:+ start:1056 stop:1259 length:204 start_codon:yes stop_codon:yes gene_type:complete
MTVKRQKPIKLKIKRIELGIRAYELASELDISTAKLSLIENGVLQPDWFFKEQSAEKLGIPYKELWE